MSRASISLVVLAVTAVLWSPAARGQQPPGARQGGPPPVQLPDGPGREQVQGACARCHGLNLIANSAGYTKAGWEDRIATMVALPPNELGIVASYLATHYPVKNVPAAVLISGPATVTIREWMAPTLGSRPHDSYAGADGVDLVDRAVGQQAGSARSAHGSDPRVRPAAEYAAPWPSEDDQGNIWYTGIQKGVIGRLDPRTGQVREHAIMEPGARGPHTPILDRRTGSLFFTMQSGHVGRLNIKTGDMLIRKTPSDNTYPYGIRLNSQGVPWYVDFRGNRIGRVDPQTLEITEYPLPNAAARPRRLTITPDDIIWYADFPRGMLGRFDPKTGQAREWLSPGGKDSEPYAITSVGDIIWYSESGVRPNTMVRFDPRTEKFQTFAIPSGGGVLRHFEATAQGNIVTANSGVNKIGFVEIGTLPTNRAN
jgi:virginiamycin B lyase